MKEHSEYTYCVRAAFALLFGLMLAGAAPVCANGASPVDTAALSRTDARPEPAAEAILDPGTAALERADLARLVEELDFLIEEARRIEARAARKGIWFYYRGLATDLGRIRGGIADHLSARQRQPNKIVKIKGRYTRRKVSHDTRPAAR